MSLLNTTDSFTKLGGIVVSTDTSLLDETWVDRLASHWTELWSFALGAALCAYVAYLSLFNKAISGDYKWFILNQAIADFCLSFFHLVQNFIQSVYFNEEEYQASVDDHTSLWSSLYYNIVTRQILLKLGFYAQTTTLFATVFNRWMAICLPAYYPVFMKPRLIVLYCLLCYLIFLPFDGGLFNLLHIEGKAIIVLLTAPLFIPWLLSILLNVFILITMWKHKCTTSGAVDEERRKEHRNVLIALMIQILVPLFDKIPESIYVLLMVLEIVPITALLTSPIVSTLLKITSFNSYFTTIYTCLIILITMRPYRESTWSMILSVAKFFKRYIKPQPQQTQIIPINLTQAA